MSDANGASAWDGWIVLCIASRGQVKRRLRECRSFGLYDIFMHEAYMHVS